MAIVKAAMGALRDYNNNYSDIVNRTTYLYVAMCCDQGVRLSDAAYQMDQIRNHKERTYARRPPQSLSVIHDKRFRPMGERSLPTENVAW